MFEMMFVCLYNVFVFQYDAAGGKGRKSVRINGGIALENKVVVTIPLVIK